MIKFTWDARKAIRNERLHGMSFPLARAALETGTGIAIEEQFREGEWRTNIVVPVRGTSLITITIASYSGDNHEDIDNGTDHQTEQDWTEGELEIRIISARESTAAEKIFYFESRQPSLG